MNPKVKDLQGLVNSRFVHFIFLFLIILISSSYFAFPQTTLLSETFEGAFPSANGWTIGDANSSGTSAYWKDVDSLFGGEGTYAGSWKGYCAGTGYAGTTANPTYQNYMSAYMSKNINLSAYSAASLTFYYKIPSIEGGSYDKLRVYIDSTIIWERSTAQTAWSQVSLSLNSYIGASRTLKFEFYSDSSGVAEGAYLDNILVTASGAAFPDLTRQTSAINKTTFFPGEQLAVDVTVLNEGSAPANSGYIHYYWEKGARSYTSTYKIGEDAYSALSAGGTSAENIAFTIPSGATPGTDYYFYYWIDATQTTSEDDENNNRYYWTITVSPLSAPSLVNAECYISPNATEPGGRLTVYYRIYNPNSVSMSVGLGSSIRKNGTTIWLSDSANDIYRTVPAGYSTQTRYFDVPSGTHGSYDVAWGLWQTIGSGSPWTIIEKLNQLSVNRAPNAPGFPYINHDSGNDTGQSQYDAITRNSKPTFSWSAATDPDGDAIAGYYVSYTDSTPDADDYWVTSATWGPGLFDPEIPEGNRTLYVCAKDSMGAVGAVSSLSFTIDKTAPAPPMFISPSEGQTISDTSPTLDWQDVAGAWKYQVYVREDGLPYLDSRTSPEFTVSTWTVSPDLGLKAWGWQVKVWDVAGNEGSFGANGTSGSWGHFTVGLSVPVITSVSPSKASAGTNTSVTIFGNNFGASQGTSKVEFFYQSGEPKIEADIISWSNTQIVCEVPVAIINDYAASASSGPVTVTTSSGISNPYTFLVSFGYMGSKWVNLFGSPVAGYRINENTSDCTGEGAAIINAANTWSAAGAAFMFKYEGSHSNTSAGWNFSSEIMWKTLSRPDVVASAYSWFDPFGMITERDIEFNESWMWSTAGTPSSETFDVESIALHELGHWLALRDLYGDIGDGINDTAKVMYGRADELYLGTTKRALHADDIAGIRWIYGLSSLQAVIWDAWWSNGVDLDGDGFKRSARLNWDPDVSGGSGSLTVFEKIYYKLKSASAWTLLVTTSPHTIIDTATNDSQYRDISGGNHDEYDWMIEIYRSGNSTPDYTRDPSNDAELDNYAMETIIEDTAPAISVTPASQDFGSILVGTTADRTFSVQNTGGGILTGSASVSAPFSIFSGGTYNLAAGASQTVTVRYSPTSAGTHNQNVSFTGGAGAIRPVTGNAYLSPAISVTPASQDFGTILVGTTADRTFTVQNVGGGTLSGSASVPTPFSIVSGSPYSLGAGVSQTVTVRYSPTSAGTHSQNVSFTGGVGASRPVSGSATLNPAISVTPASQDFGSIQVGSTADRTFTVQNTGGGTLSGSASVAAPFSIVSGGTYNLAASASQTVTVRYSPTAAGTHNQNVSFTGGSGATRPVSGSAYVDAVITVTPASQDFGSIQVGSTADRTFTVQNTGGGTLSGSASVAAPFSIVSGGTYNLAASASQTVTVRYSPTAAGTHNQNVSFTGGSGAIRPVSGSAFSTNAYIFNFNEGTGTTFNDANSNGISGSIGNCTQWTNTEIRDDNGAFGYGLYFNGSTNDTILSAQPVSNGPFTIMFWAKKTDANGGELVRTNTPGGMDGYLIGQLADGSVYSFVCTSSGHPDLVSSPVASNEWFHVALVYDLAMQKLYVNGILAQEASQTGALTAPGYLFSIGRGYSGKMDGLKIFQSALSVAQIQQVFAVEDPTTVDIFYDNFEDGDLAGWSTLEGQVTASTENKKNCDYTMRMYDNSNGSAIDVRLVASTVSNRIGFDFWAYCNSDSYNAGQHFLFSPVSNWDTTKALLISADSVTGKNWKYFYNGAYYDFPVPVSATDNIWHKIRLEIDGPIGKAYLWYDGDYKGEFPYYVTNDPIKYFQHAVSYNGAVGATNYFDDFRVYELPQSTVTPTLTVTSPDGGEIWVIGESKNVTWGSTGTVSNVNIDFSANNGVSWISIATNTANDGIHTWTIPSTASTSCLVRIQDAVDGDPSDTSNSVFSIVSGETVTAPSTPVGLTSGNCGTSYSYSTGGSTTSLGHSVQYKFDWDDGSDSGWLAVGTTSASHIWAAAGTYDVRAMARCATHTTVESLWSSTLAMSITCGGSTGFYNSPAQRLFLPEATWALASGSGDWVSELQLVDCTGGSTVQVYYSTGTSRRGPFTLWSNGSGAAGSSVIFSNIVQTIDGLDGSATTYYGTGGALELVTQDGSHRIQAAVRSYNGNFSRTFPALADNETNTAATGRTLIIPNLSNDASYRPSVVLFNPSADSVTLEGRIIGSNGSQVGSTINRTLAGYEQNTIVTEVRSNTYSNADFRVTVTGGAGRVIASGQSANNVSNDPAAHIAVQTAAGYANSMGQRLVLPETTWALASGSGDWVSEVHVTDLSGGAVVTAWYNTGTSRRGPFTLWTNGGGAGCSTTFGNIVQTLDGLDGSATTYYGTGGSLELVTQDGSHLVQAAVRTYNGNFSRTFPGLLDREETTAALGRTLLIPNICNNSLYRPSVVLFNPTADSVTVEVKIIGSAGTQLGSTINRVLTGYQQNTIVDEVRAFSYDNAKVQVTVTAGTGRVIVSGQSANNTSNDPAAHVAVQGQ
jgi:hypothetical protein